MPSSRRSRRHFAEDELVKLTVLIGTINAWNRIAIGFRSVHPPAPAHASARRGSTGGAMMRQGYRTHRRLPAAAALLSTGVILAGIVLAGPTSSASAEGAGAEVKQAFAEKLPNVPGKTLTALVVTYGPGGHSSAHHHAGSVFAYVLSGTIRSENSATGPARVYSAGESFFEPPGSEHLVSENASATEPASLLAVFVADDGAPLTTFDK